MTAFSASTPFELVRRLAAAGQNSPSVYLLIAEADALGAVQADIAAEIQVQLGSKIRLLTVSAMALEELEEALRMDEAWTIVLLTVGHWAPQLIGSIDLHVVLLTRGGTVLLLAASDLAERLLATAPNLRNRLTDVLLISPEPTFGGAPA